jgi:molybdopterin converting factor small subunit
MQIDVKYMAQLRHAAGVAVERIVIDSPCTAASLLRRLADGRGDSFRRMLLAEDGTLQPAILLFVGDEQIRADIAHDFRDGDQLTILAPMAGG